MATNMNGPYLSAALLCEKVLQEKDGVISIIRTIDRAEIRISAEEYPEGTKVPPSNLSFYSFVSFKAGDERGISTIKWSMKTPSGEMLLEKLLPISFENGEEEAEFILALHITVNQEGVYWTDVFLEDQLVTRIPLRVVFVRMG